MAQLSSATRARIADLVRERFVTVRKHPEAALSIYNYTAKAQFAGRWTEELALCRGLILDGDGQIIARPFPKFFNLAEHPGPLPNEPFEVFEKLDGSLGILYRLGGQPFLATRGSFTGEQAQRGTQILQQKYPQIRFDPSLTYLFEIIYPENRIVVDYGQTEDIFLLAVIDTETGQELPLPNIGVPLVRAYDGIADLATLAAYAEPNKEGFVVRFRGGVRVKVKLEEYVRLHRLVTGVTAKDLWEYLRDGKPLDVLLDHVPDEFFVWVQATIKQLQDQYRAIEETARQEFRDLGDRKANALYYKQCTYPAILFRMLDQQDYSEQIWKLIKPPATNPFKEEV